MYYKLMYEYTKGARAYLDEMLHCSKFKSETELAVISERKKRPMASFA